MSTNYQPIANEFDHKGFHYRLIERRGDLAIFEQSKIVAYEVVEIQKRDAWEIAGNSIPAHEAIPSSEQWGTKGFTCIDLDAAKNRLGRMERGEIRPELPDEEPESVVNYTKPNKELILPVGEFTVGELAAKNGVLYPIAFAFVKCAVGEKKVKFLREERKGNARRPSKIYSKV